MFEEIPRQRRGLGQLTARRVAFGPFAVGGGLLLTALGGSVAVAATVITASTIGLSGLGPTHGRHIAAPLMTTSNPPAPRSTFNTSAAGSTNPPRPSARASARPANPPVPARSGGAATPGPVTTPRLTSRSVPTPRATSSGRAAGPSSSGPAGNAVIYFDGYDSASGSLLFRYATVTPGAGPGGRATYSASGATDYRAKLAPSASIVSGDSLCPPAGSQCSASQLIAAAPSGLYAEVGIDAAGALRSVIERNNAPSPTNTATSGAASPTSPAVAATTGPS